MSASSSKITFNLDIEKCKEFFTLDLVDFLSDIAQEFQPRINELLEKRKQKKLDVDMYLTTPEDIVEYLMSNAPVVVSTLCKPNWVKFVYKYMIRIVCSFLITYLLPRKLRSSGKFNLCQRDLKIETLMPVM